MTDASSVWFGSESHSQTTRGEAEATAPRGTTPGAWGLHSALTPSQAVFSLVPEVTATQGTFRAAAVHA